MGLDEGRIDEIVEIVVSRLQREGFDFSGSDTVPSTHSPAMDGVFQEMDECIQAALECHRFLVTFTAALLSKQRAPLRR